MKLAIISILSFFLSTYHAVGQTTIVTGKVIDENFYPVYNAKLFKEDTVLLSTTDASGNFMIEIPTNTRLLTVASIAMESKHIHLTDNCSNLEIILLNSGSYDFLSAGKVDRLRKKEFNKLPSLHLSAFEKSVFKNDKPCYLDKFVSHKKELKEIHRNRSKMPST